METSRMYLINFTLVLLACAVICQPIEKPDTVDHLSHPLQHSLRKRFINPSLTFGSFSDSGIGKIRTKRSSAEECEKLQLCKLHARSSHSFLAAFELYFVNKENARLWDHRARTNADCERRFSCYR
ncbi:uncharacterized protein [Epargyreus clarus]|uniref:uncharacterized protein n=1 Tax=Epargyreus clarus TaxID=520877 RepID=UPI003C2D6D71